VHSRAHAHIGCDSGKQHVAAAPALGDCREAVILGVQPRDNRPDEPFPGPVVRFLRTIREPEARFEIAAETDALRPS